MAEKFSNGVRAVSEVAIEMRQAIIELAGNRAVFDTRDLWLERAARQAGISHRMAKTLFYCESNNPSSEVVDSVRKACERKHKKARTDAEVAAAARDEYGELLARIERLETALRVQDADFHSGSIDAARETVSRARRDRGPVDRTGGMTTKP